MVGPEASEGELSHGDVYVEIAGWREGSSSHRVRRGAQRGDNAMEWQTTGLLMIPGKGQSTDVADYYSM